MIHNPPHSLTTFASNPFLTQNGRCHVRSEAWILQAARWYPNPKGWWNDHMSTKRLGVILQIWNLQSCLSIFLIPFPCCDDPPGKPLSTKNIFGTIYGCRFFHGSAPLLPWFFQGTIPLGTCETNFDLCGMLSLPKKHATNSDSCNGSWTSWVWVCKSDRLALHMFSNEFEGRWQLRSPHPHPRRGPQHRVFRWTVGGCRHIRPARSRCGPCCALAFLPRNLEIVDWIFITKNEWQQEWKLAFPPINLEIVEWIFITKKKQDMESAKWIIKGSPPLASAIFWVSVANHHTSIFTDDPLKREDSSA